MTAWIERHVCIAQDIADRHPVHERECLAKLRTAAHTSDTVPKKPCFTFRRGFPPPFLGLQLMSPLLSHPPPRPPQKAEEDDLSEEEGLDRAILIGEEWGAQAA